VFRWTPDENRYCNSLADLPAEVVAEIFGTNPLLISCWTCLFGTLSQDESRALQEAADSDVLHALEADEHRQAAVPSHERFRMGPRALARAVMGSTPARDKRAR
jgi:hypothetical protein